MSRIWSRPSRREPVGPGVSGTADFSHLSIELGRFSAREIVDDQDRVRRWFSQSAGWLAAVRASADVGRSPLRASTCILLDDYFHRDADPAAVFGSLLAAAQEAGLRIDYVVRLAGMADLAAAVGDGGPVGMVAARLVSEPSPGANGTRPPVQESGWLCNGRRSLDVDATEAMQRRTWAPPKEYAAAGHSIFVDVELWREEPGSGAVAQRVWSRALLTATWLLLCLGQLHSIVTPAVEPVLHAPETGWPEYWDRVPAVVKINPAADPLPAYRAVSIAPQTDLSLEHAVRLVLDAFAVDPDATARIESCLADEGLSLEPEISGRLSRILLPLAS